jgi:hypothetical protein
LRLLWKKKVLPVQQDLLVLPVLLGQVALLEIPVLLGQLEVKDQLEVKVFKALPEQLDYLSLGQQVHKVRKEFKDLPVFLVYKVFKVFLVFKVQPEYKVQPDLPEFLVQ